MAVGISAGEVRRATVANSRSAYLVNNAMRPGRSNWPRAGLATWVGCEAAGGA